MIRVLTVLILVATGSSAVAQDIPQAIREILDAGAPPVTDIDAALGSDSLAALKRVYDARGNQPIWSDAAIAVLLERLQAIAFSPKLLPLLKSATEARDPAQRDLLLSALYGATAKVLNPTAPADLEAALTALAKAGDSVALLNPPQQPEPPKVERESATPAAPPEPPAIAGLRAVIAAYQQAKGWPHISDGPKLQQGDTGARVDALRHHLLISGDLKAMRPDGTEFDDALKAALQHFQARHGLPDDGVAGAATIAALNVSVPDRIATLNANLQRLQHDPGDWGDRYLVVNLAAADYRLVEAGRTVAQGPAIVGAPASPTPLLSGTIDRLALHPSWRIPQKVADRLLWPKQDADATYFYNHGIHVQDDGLIQDPGPGNPLGAVKLLLAGNDALALHGAPQAAFDTPDRATSLGCVALSGVVDLAKRLLAADPAWPQGRVDGAFAVGGPATVILAQPLAVHFVYHTAWVAEDGTVEFRDDLYGWDKPGAAQPVLTDGGCAS